jgi:hypothetical protein
VIHLTILPAAHNTLAGHATPKPRCVHVCKMKLIVLRAETSR